MFRLWIALLAALPFQSGEGFADLVPELSRLSERDAHGRPAVGDERLRAIEARIGAFLGLPRGLAVALAAEDGSRRAVLAGEELALRILRPGKTRTLLDLSVSIDGQRVTGEHLAFVDPSGRAPLTRQLLERRGSPPQALARLPLLFERMQWLLDAADERGLELVSLVPTTGNANAAPPYAELRYTVAVGTPDRRMNGYAVLVLDPAAPPGRAPTTRVGSDAVTPPALVRAVGRSFASVLDSAVQVIERLDFPFAHSLELEDDPFGVNNGLVPPDNLVLELEHAGRTLTRARLWKDAATPDWRVTEWTGKRLAESVPLEHYVQLLRAAVALADTRAESAGVFALSGAGASTAVLVTLPEGSLWEAPSAHAHAFEVRGDGPAQHVESVELTSIAVAPDSPHGVFRASSADGRVLELRRSLIGCGTEADPDPPVCFGDVRALLLGGSALPDPIRRR